MPFLRLRLRANRFSDSGSGSGSDQNVLAPAPAPHPCSLLMSYLLASRFYTLLFCETHDLVWEIISLSEKRMKNCTVKITDNVFEKMKDGYFISFNLLRPTDVCCSFDSHDSPLGVCIDIYTVGRKRLRPADIEGSKIRQTAGGISCLSKSAHWWPLVVSIGYRKKCDDRFGNRSVRLNNFGPFIGQPPANTFLVPIFCRFFKNAVVNY